jgi:hypothetical protein
MVMTGFLPTHSIDTEFPEDKVEEQVERMQAKLQAHSINDVVLTALRLGDDVHLNEEVLTCILTAMDIVPGSSARDLLTYSDKRVVEVAASLRRHNAFESLSEQKADFIEAIPAEALMHGGVSRSLRTMEEGTLDAFYGWLCATAMSIIGYLLATPFKDTAVESHLETVLVSAINLDVPTEAPATLMGSAMSYPDKGRYYRVINATFPWYGRKIIQHDIATFVRLLALHLAQVVI